MSNLWTPPSATHDVSFKSGTLKDVEGTTTHKIKVVDPETKKTGEVVVIAESDISQARLEDMIGTAVENWTREVREKVQRKDGKVAPVTDEEKKNVGIAVREYMKEKRKMSESTNNKLYY